MKRITALILSLLLMITTLPVSIFAADTASAEDLVKTIKINSEYMDFDIKLVVLAKANYQMLAPARKMAEKLGAELSWDEASQTITFTRTEWDGKVYTVSCSIGSLDAKANGKDITLETVPEMINDTAYVPVELLGENLHWRMLVEDYGRTIRFISYTNLTSPKYNGEIKPGMAELISTVHRPVVTEFERSNDLNDLIFYTDYEYIPEEELLKEKVLDTSNLPKGEVIYTNDDFVDSAGSGKQAEGYWGPVEIDDETVPFDKALQVTCTYVPSNTTFFIVKPTKRIAEYVDPADKYLVSYYVRLVSGGHVDTGAGRAFIHVEEDYKSTWIKSVAETTDFDTNWTKVYALATGVENANHIGVTACHYLQTVQVGGFEVQKLDRDADTSMFEEYMRPVDLISPEMSKDAPWRQEAIDRIEYVRKGDFKVKVQDKNGNPIEGANVEFDMFEHEFRWGTTLDFASRAAHAGSGYPAKYMQAISENFNSVGAGNAQKISYFDANRNSAIRKMADAASQGIKYFRGHAIWMPSLQTGPLERPARFYNDGATSPANIDEETFEKYVKSHIEQIAAALPMVTEWDVANEMCNRVTWDSNFGEEYLEDMIFKWADEILPDYVDKAYCDNQLQNPKYWQILDRFQRKNVPYDVIAYQGHSYDFANDPLEGARRLSEFRKIFDRYTYEYGKQFTITEFSCRSDSFEHQADFLRDTILCAFSNPGCNAFTMFWMTDHYADTQNTATGLAPLYDKNFNKKLGWYMWQDLVYNKFWTRDAVTTTDEDGFGQVRGFYGDYDVTVTVGGKVVKTEMAAFHKGYENVLTITID